jgi:type I restriction-modification system DNA methylase subunit
MVKNWDKKRIKDLGIFYTPQEVVDFIFEILNIWKENQTNRWITKELKHKYPSVIDPSAGEGIF